MAKTRFFRVAVEGATVDGREISRDWIDQMAASYNPATYGARINCEHLRGFSPEGPFNAYGDVLALKAEDVTLDVGGKSETRRALFAQLDVTDQLVAYNRARQKLYTSIEVAPNFAKTGGAYLVGLAVTDNPASLGTEMLQFAAGLGDKSPLASRKQDPANHFSAATELLDVTPEEAPAGQAAGAPSLFAQVLTALGGGAVAEAFGKLTGGQAAQAAAAEPAPAGQAAPATPPAANDNGAQFTAALAVIANQVEANQRQTAEQFGQLQASLTKLTGQLETTEDPAQTRRPPATGAAAFSRTDF